ncbi:MAG: RNA 2',3'-cyclic phosphodiesterase [Anaerolineae bacterium]|nr:RNA 2',3'-cyclic phosphodiesterase [Anaerolineae bacterium]
MNPVRAFIALEIPQLIQESIEKQTTRLRLELGNDLVRWVPTHNMHLTLKFLGDVASPHMEFIKSMLNQIAETHTGFDLQIGSIGSFPNLKRPRVIWVGIYAPAGLAPLQKSIEERTVRLGYEKEERPFSPHLTLGRVRQRLTAQETQKISNTLSTIQLGKIGTARVNSLHLYQSDLNSEGSIYTKLFSTSLR